MNYFIIATHGTLAQGFKESINFFIKGLNNIRYINAYIDDVDFEVSFQETLDTIPSNATLCVCTDMKGGSVNQIAMKYKQKDKYFLISGINLPLLLTLVLSGETLNQNIINNAILEAKNELIHIEF